MKLKYPLIDLQGLRKSLVKEKDSLSEFALSPSNHSELISLTNSKLSKFEFFNFTKIHTNKLTDPQFISTEFSNGRLVDIRLSCNLIKSIIDTMEFIDSRLENTKIDRVTITSSQFFGFSTRRVQVDISTFSDCSFVSSSLVTTAFVDCSFAGLFSKSTHFKNCNFINTTFGSTKVIDSSFSGCTFISCKLPQDLLEIIQKGKDNRVLD